MWEKKVKAGERGGRGRRETHIRSLNWHGASNVSLYCKQGKKFVMEGWIIWVSWDVLADTEVRVLCRAYPTCQNHFILYHITKFIPITDLTIQRQVCYNISWQSLITSISTILDEESRGSCCFLLSSYKITLVFSEREQPCRISLQLSSKFINWYFLFISSANVSLV
jgi:hypothetical protein